MRPDARALSHVFGGGAGPQASQGGSSLAWVWCVGRRFQLRREACYEFDLPPIPGKVVLLG